MRARSVELPSLLTSAHYLTGPQGEGFDVMKSGDARVALIGFPSVGKVIAMPYIWSLCKIRPNPNHLILSQVHPVEQADDDSE